MFIATDHEHNADDREIPNREKHVEFTDPVGNIKKAVKTFVFHKKWGIVLKYVQIIVCSLFFFQIIDFIFFKTIFSQIFDFQVFKIIFQAVTVKRHNRPNRQMKQNAPNIQIKSLEVEPDKSPQNDQNTEWCERQSGEQHANGGGWSRIRFGEHVADDFFRFEVRTVFIFSSFVVAW